ncbi:hypothetical protein [Mycoplasmopsis meleagridis]|uniref:hypothetical protein n=1 Tax=Mycoplasmopsis meleagridis TaxID=29561 RepID=UPI00137927C6|nr:hypothetical protein [Mycoplasmopsis meleagridis]
MANIIDLIIFFFFVICQYLFLVIMGKNLVIGIYVFIALSILTSIIFFILIPLFLNARTIGYLILRLQYLSLEKNKYLPIYKIVLKKAVFSSFFWIFICFVFVCLIYPSDFNNFKNSISLEKVAENSNPRFLIAYKILTTIISFFILLFSFNYISILVKRNRIAILDYVSGTRIVYMKHIQDANLQKDIKLIPYRAKNEKIVYFFKEKNDA